MTGPADFHGQNLRRRSFKGEELNGVDFTVADLRGADFSNASLVNANFTDARMGVTPLVASLILLLALAVSLVAGVAVGHLAKVTRAEFSSADWRDVFGGSLMLAVVLLFLGLLVFKGASTALRTYVIAIVAIIVVDFAVVFIFAGEVRFRNAIPLVIALVLTIPAVIAGILGRMVGGTFGAWAIAIVAVLGGLAAGRAGGGLAAVIVSVLLVLLSKRALKGDIRDGPMRHVGHRIASHRGTRFTDADLTRANFTGTALVHSDMSSAVFQGVIWGSDSHPYIEDATN
jgi:MFS family permease